MRKLLKWGVILFWSVAIGGSLAWLYVTLVLAVPMFAFVVRIQNQYPDQALFFAGMMWGWGFLWVVWPVVKKWRGGQP